MKKARLFFYWATLVLLMFLYYGISESLYLTIGMDLNGGALVGVMLVASLIVPFVIVLGLIRLWLLKPISQRSRLSDVLYFVIPVAIIIACFVVQLWVGTILSVFAGILIAYEFIRSVVKTF